MMKLEVIEIMVVAIAIVILIAIVGTNPGNVYIVNYALALGTLIMAFAVYKQATVQTELLRLERPSAEVHTKYCLLSPPKKGKIPKGLKWIVNIEPAIEMINNSKATVYVQDSKLHLKTNSGIETIGQSAEIFAGPITLKPNDSGRYGPIFMVDPKRRLDFSEIRGAELELIGNFKKKVKLDLQYVPCSTCKGEQEVDCEVCKAVFRHPGHSIQFVPNPRGGYTFLLKSCSVENDGFPYNAKLRIRISDRHSLDIIKEQLVSISIKGYERTNIGPIRLELGNMENLKKELGREPKQDDILYNIKIVDPKPAKKCKKCGGKGKVPCPRCQ
jgi:hypothetical protein